MHADKDSGWVLKVAQEDITAYTILSGEMWEIAIPQGTPYFLNEESKQIGVDEAILKRKITQK